MSTPMTCVASKQRRYNIRNGTHGTIRIILSDLGRPGCGTITTVEHTTNGSHWWKEKFSVEDNIAHLMLNLKSVRLVLQASQSNDLGSISVIAYLINRHEVDGVIDGEVLIVAPVNSGELDVLVVQRCGACLRIPRGSRTHQSASTIGESNSKN